MERSLQTSLVLHGAVVVLIGLLVGIPYGNAITGGADAEIIRAWRAAHDGLIMGGLLLIAAGPASALVDLGALGQVVLARALIVSAYAFAVALTSAAVFGFRGLEPVAPAMNVVVFVANSIGAVGSLVGVGLFVTGAARAGRRKD